MTRPASPTPWPRTRGWNWTTKTWSLGNTGWFVGLVVGSLVFFTCVSMFGGAGGRALGESYGRRRVAARAGRWGVRGPQGGARGVLVRTGTRPHDAGSPPGVWALPARPNPQAALAGWGARRPPAAAAGRAASVGAACGAGGAI